MRENLASETALKVAHSVLCLSHTDDWGDRLPPRVGDMTEKLMLAAELPRYTPRVIASAKGSMMRSAYRMNDWMMPGLFEGLGHRKIFMNDCALAAMEDGFAQIVVVGAGFDTLSIRLAPEFATVRFFEIDHPATAAPKRKALLSVGRPDNVHLLAVDLAEHRLEAALTESDAWDPGRRTLFIAEGLLMYLTRAQVEDLLQQASAAAAAGSRFAFSYCHPRWARSFRGGMGRVLARMVGEPIQSWVTPEHLPELLAKGGWSVRKHSDYGKPGEVERFAEAES